MIGHRLGKSFRMLFAVKKCKQCDQKMGKTMIEEGIGVGPQSQ